MRRCLALAIALLTPPSFSYSPQTSATSGAMLKTPTGAEILEYGVEWRFVRAGVAKMTHMRRPTGAGWQTDLHVEAGGMVAKLFKVNDDYSTMADSQYCTASTFLRAQEGSRSRETKVTFEHSKASYIEKDLLKNTVQTKELDVPPCVHDVINSLYHLRTLRLDTGKNIVLPLSDGKKSVSARIEAQERETVKTPLGQFKTIRYEAFLFNEVLYTRKGRLFIWLTDDDRRLPVQIRVRLNVAVGTITLQLEKEAST